MKRKIAPLILGLLCTSSLLKAQSKVFKEVSKDIETKVEAIMQDHSLVGYLIFNKLERINRDSFNYKLNILDENLNDIGSFSFKNQNLQVQDVAFDQDVLCVGYLRNNAPDKIKGKFKNEIHRVKSSVYLQFLNLNGELIKDYSEPVNATFFESDFYVIRSAFTNAKANNYSNTTFKGMLRNSIQIKNIPQKGFSLCFTESKFVNGTTIKHPDDYFDARNVQHYELFDFKGEQLWQQSLPNSKLYFSTTVADGSILYLLRKNKIEKTSEEGGYELLCIAAADGSILKQSQLKDGSGNPLNVLNFTNDLNNNNPIINGIIISKRKSPNDGEEVASGGNKGVFTINIKDTSFSSLYSNWSEGKYKPVFSKKGYVSEIKSYTDTRHSFTDENGDNYYVGTGVIKKTKWGSVAAAIITSPLLVPPLFIMIVSGYTKYKYRDEIVLKQTKDGQLSYFASLSSNNTKSKTLLTINRADYRAKNYFTVSNNKYLVINDNKDIFIYDIATKSLRKKIPHKSGDTKMQIFKAKEGHIMISEHNSSEKSTTLSIEAI